MSNILQTILIIICLPLVTWAIVIVYFIIRKTIDSISSALNKPKLPKPNNFSFTVPLREGLPPYPKFMQYIQDEQTFVEAQTAWNLVETYRRGYSGDNDTLDPDQYERFLQSTKWSIEDAEELLQLKENIEFLQYLRNNK